MNLTSFVHVDLLAANVIVAAIVDLPASCKKTSNLLLCFCLPNSHFHTTFPKQIECLLLYSAAFSLTFLCSFT